MKARNSIKISIFILYSLILVILGSFFYKYKTYIDFYFDSPLEARYLMDDVHNKNFVFDVFRYVERRMMK